VPGSRLSIGSASWALALGALGTGSPPATAADDLATWAHSQILYYDTSPTGADVGVTIANFPVLVRLRAGDFPFAQAMGGGQDLRFAKPDGTPIGYEIERWDSLGAKADIWLRTDSLFGDSKNMLAKMYWGKPGSVSGSDGGAVFNAATGFEYVWHLGGAGVAARPNAVATRPAAVPINADADESKDGIAGLCDSLDGKASGDHLDIGDGYTEFSGNMTVSMWAYPTRAAVWSRLFDLGNGAGADNLYFGRRGNSQDLIFASYNSTSGLNGQAVASNALALDAWQFFALTVSGQTVSIYRNGTLVATGTLSVPVSNIRRVSNFLGRSNWSADEYFTGKLDEVEMSHWSHTANWFKLAYANQKPDQNLITFAPPVTACVNPAFSAPADTLVTEGSLLALAGVADCATAYHWDAIAGPAPRILDPEVKVLQIAVPRVSGDTSILYRFTAMVSGSARTRDVLVRIKEAIPDPIFTLASAAWNGKDSLLVKPVVQNLDKIKASSEPLLYYDWTLSGLADTAWRKDGLLLRTAPAGTLAIGLCLNNDGPKVCHTAQFTVGPATGIVGDPAAAGAAGAKARRDARGRALKRESAAKRLRSLPAFPARAR
jgi:hypothetical protein